MGGLVDLEEFPVVILRDIEFILLNYVKEDNWENLYYFFQVIEKHSNIAWSENILERLNYYLKNTDLDALDKFNKEQTPRKLSTSILLKL